MNEWNENMLDEQLEALIEDLPEHNDLEEKIIAGINRRVRKIARRTVFCFIAVILVALLVINPLLNVVTLNPYKMNQEPDHELTEIFRDYFETNIPFREVNQIEVKKKGFGCYELKVYVTNLAETKREFPSDYFTIDMNLGTFGDYTDTNRCFFQMLGRFENDYQTTEEFLELFQKLPESSVLFLSLSDADVKNIDELRKLDIRLDWFQVYQPSVQFQGGMAAHMTSAYTEGDYREEMTEQQLLQEYIAHLENLLENPKLWHKFGLCDGSNAYPVNPINRLEETYENAKDLTELKTKNYCISGERDEIIKYLQENRFESIRIDNICLY